MAHNKIKCQGEEMEDYLHRGEVLRFLKLNRKTLEKYERRGLLTPAILFVRSNGAVVRGYPRIEILDLKMRMRKKRLPGISLLKPIPNLLKHAVPLDKWK